MATTLKIFANTDIQDLPLDTSGVDWTEIDTSNDFLVFTAGSDTVKDGEAIPSASKLNQAGVLISSSDQIVSKYLLADMSANLLKEIHNAGNQDKQYVLAFSFDGAVASEPVLEVWDDSNLNTVNDYCLGEGVASNSWIRGITTTDGSSGANWTGSRLAGSSDGHFLWLNDNGGAFETAKVLYCNLKIIVPANFANAGANTPIFCIKYTTN